MSTTNPLTSLLGANASYTPAATTKTELGKDDFMQLLVTQLRNQDPLSPMENQEFAAQLAQFGSLEQLSSIDTKIGEGVNVDLILTQAINNSMAATLIGKEITAIGDTIYLEQDGSAEIGFKLNSFASDVKVNIKDAAGNVVRTLEASGMGSGKQTLEWDGKNGDGETLPSGTYSYEVTATDSDGNSIGVLPLMMGYVSSVRYTDGGAVLIVNGNEITFADVLEIGDEEEKTDR
jgi:flagellar basal-body rod modification protein FlgD